MPTAELPVDRYLQGLHAAYSDLDDGAVADYIPALAAADPRPLRHLPRPRSTARSTRSATAGCRSPSSRSPSRSPTAWRSRTTASAGSASRSASSRPATPSTRSASTPRGRPSNPMINAGAIMAASLVAGADAARPSSGSSTCYAAWAGRDAGRRRGASTPPSGTPAHRNRAIAHMLRAVGMLDGDPERALDVLLPPVLGRWSTTRDLARDGGDPRQPRRPSGHPRARARRRTYVDHVLSVMTTCGMYDAAGEWLVDVGIPAKSGVGGGIIGVLPGQLGVGGLLPAAGPGRQQPARGRGVPQARRGPAAALPATSAGPAPRPSPRRTCLADVPSTRRRAASGRRSTRAGGGAGGGAER